MLGNAGSYPPQSPRLAAAKAPANIRDAKKRRQGSGLSHKLSPAPLLFIAILIYTLYNIHNSWGECLGRTLLGYKGADASQ
jgi:hypothetical protein